MCHVAVCACHSDLTAGLPNGVSECLSVSGQLRWSRACAPCGSVCVSHCQCHSDSVVYILYTRFTSFGPINNCRSVYSPPASAAVSADYPSCQLPTWNVRGGRGAAPPIDAQTEEPLACGSVRAGFCLRYTQQQLEGTDRIHSKDTRRRSALRKASPRVPTAQTLDTDGRALISMASTPTGGFSSLSMRLRRCSGSPFSSAAAASDAFEPRPSSVADRGTT